MSWSLIPLKRLLPQLTAAALLLATALPGSAWAGAAFNKTLALQGINFQVQSSGEGSQHSSRSPPRAPSRRSGRFAKR